MYQSLKMYITYIYTDIIGEIEVPKWKIINMNIKNIYFHHQEQNELRWKTAPERRRISLLGKGSCRVCFFVSTFLL